MHIICSTWLNHYFGTHTNTVVLFIIAFPVNAFCTAPFTYMRACLATWMWTGACAGWLKAVELSQPQLRVAKVSKVPRQSRYDCWLSSKHLWQSMHAWADSREENFLPLPHDACSYGVPCMWRTSDCVQERDQERWLGPILTLTSCKWLFVSFNPHNSEYASRVAPHQEHIWVNGKCLLVHDSKHTAPSTKEKKVLCLWGECNMEGEWNQIVKNFFVKHTNTSSCKDVTSSWTWFHQTILLPHRYPILHVNQVTQGQSHRHAFLHHKHSAMSWLYW